MKRQWITAVIAGAALMPTITLAQDGDVHVFTYDDSHGRIGVMVDAKADDATDKLGARIQSVVPDGPAAEAGLKAGDIITSFNGQSLAGAAAEDDDRSGPADKLVDLAGALDPGDEVTVSYRRGDETKTVTLTAESLGGNFVFRSPRMRMRTSPKFDIHPDASRPLLELMPGGSNLWRHRGRGGLDLAELNDDLAEYFGASEGALVMETPDDSTLALKGGDVIVAIDGRAVESPEHARRILASYNVGETASIEVLRKRAPTTVTWTVPEQASGGYFFRQPGELHEAKPRRERQA
jgi:S1-C subfamily serine protease